MSDSEEIKKIADDIKKLKEIAEKLEKAIDRNAKQTSEHLDKIWAEIKKEK